jgi:hypothetical protein
MKEFETTYWNQLQAVLWICTRRRRWVQLAADPNRDLDEFIFNAILRGTVVPFEQAESLVIERLRRGELRAWGLRNGTGDLEEIEQTQWADLRFYYHPLRQRTCTSSLSAAPQNFLRPDSTYWTQLTLKREDVLAFWPENLSKRGSPPPEQVQPREPQRRGRKPKYDWESFQHEITRIANTPDGLPEFQSELEEMMADWCLSTWGKEPAESTIRSHVTTVYQKAKNR